jgi:hypothetical protein
MIGYFSNSNVFINPLEVNPERIYNILFTFWYIKNKLNKNNLKDTFNFKN